MYLQLEGYSCTVFDDNDMPGGQLRYSVGQDKLPWGVLDVEIEFIRQLGVQFTCNTRIGRDIQLKDLQRDFAAVYVATGEYQNKHKQELALPEGSNGILFDRNTYQTKVDGVFAGGDCLRVRKMAIRSCAQGKDAAVSIDQYVSGKKVTGPVHYFNTRMSSLQEDELKIMLDQVSNGSGIKVSEPDGAFTVHQAKAEALRCLHCDCRKPDSCKLRMYSRIYGAKPNKYKSSRKVFSINLEHPDLVYEPGKCIKCGLCVKVTVQKSEQSGLCFSGRGFNTMITAPLNKTMAEALTISAKDCVNACPTGALAFRLDEVIDSL
jgi:ferredoxin